MKRLVVKQTRRAARDNRQWRADAALQLSISSFLPRRHPLFSAKKKKRLLAIVAWCSHRHSESRRLNVISRKSCSSAPPVRKEIHQRLVYLLFPHARKGQSLRITARCPSGTQWKPCDENNIIHILNSWHQTEGTLHWGANYSTSQGSCSKPQQPRCTSQIELLFHAVCKTSNKLLAIAFRDFFYSQACSTNQTALFWKKKCRFICV